jgi:hypothetical protein
MLIVGGIGGGCRVADAASSVSHAEDSVVSYTDDAQGFAISHPRDGMFFVHY